MDSKFLILTLSMLVIFIQGCATKPKILVRPPDISGIEIPVLVNLIPREINFRVFDQRKSKYPANLKHLVREYRRILREAFRRSGIRVSRRATNGISFYIREERGRYRKRLDNCVYMSGRLRSKRGHWINVGTSTCKTRAVLNKNLLNGYLSMFKENLNSVFIPMDKKLLL